MKPAKLRARHRALAKRTAKSMCEAMGIPCTEWHVKVALGEIEVCYRTLNGPKPHGYPAEVEEEEAQW